MPSTEAPILALVSSEVPSSVGIIGVLFELQRFTCAIPLLRPRLRLIFVVFRLLCFAEIFKQGSQHPHLGFQCMGFLLQLFRGLPTNLMSDLPLSFSSWTPLFFLLLESLVVPTSVLALQAPSQFVVLPPRCFLCRYFHYLHSPFPPILKRNQCL